MPYSTDIKDYWRRSWGLGDRPQFKNDKTIKQLTALRKAGVNPLIKKTATSEATYIPRDQRLFENLKVPGYENPENSDASYKKLNEQEKTKQYADKIINTDYEKNKHTYSKIKKF